MVRAVMIRLHRLVTTLFVIVILLGVMVWAFELGLKETTVVAADNATPQSPSQDNRERSSGLTAVVWQKIERQFGYPRDRRVNVQ